MLLLLCLNAEPTFGVSSGCECPRQHLVGEMSGSPVGEWLAPLGKLHPRAGTRDAKLPQSWWEEKGAKKGPPQVWAELPRCFVM